MNLKTMGKTAKRLLLLLLAMCLTVSLAFGCVSSVSAAENSLKERVEKALGEATLYNTSTSAELTATLQSKLGSGYTVAISDWIISRAVGGCKDQTGMLFEGYDGFASGTAAVSGGGESVNVPFTVTIKPTITTYKFASEAYSNYFYPDPDSDQGLLRGDVEGRAGEYFTLSADGKMLLGYCGEAEKIVIPEGVTTMDQSWWLDTNLENVRCIILPDSLTVLPDQFGVPFQKNIEVIIVGDNVTEAEGWHTFWKCYYLKHLRLSDNLKNFTEEALFETISLSEVKLPSKLEVVGKGTFHLTALREIVIPTGVTEIGQEAFAWPLRKADYISEGVRTQGNAVPKSITTELEPLLAMNVFDSSGNILPRIITMLTKDAAYDMTTKSHWGTGYSWTPITVRYLPDSTTKNYIDTGYKPEAVTYAQLNMTLSEVKGRVASALQTIPVTSATTAKDIEDYVKEAVYSPNIKSITVKDYKYTAPTAGADGTATATVTVNYGNETAEIPMNRTLKYHAPITVGDEAPESESADNSTQENDWLSATIVTDKDSYKINEDIKITLKLANKSVLNLDNVKVSFDKAGRLALKSGNLNPTAYQLTAGEYKEHTAVVIRKESLDSVPEWISDIQSSVLDSIPKLGENPVVTIVTFIVAIACIAGAILLGRKLNSKKISAALVCLIVAAAISFPIMHANAATEKLTVSKRISVDGERYVISATVAFNLSEEAKENRDNNYTVDWDI